ncbi:MAG: helix-turn-helix domain-containing protein [Planctomycetaceae bacterium]
MRDPHSFLVMEENRFAYAAVMQLRTGEASRPCRLVTVTAPSGCGKSHLARQLVREARTENPKLSEIHVTAGELGAEYAAAAQGSCIPEFQESFRRTQLLIVEDLQMLNQRDATQQELLALVDDVIARGGRVLLTANQPMGELRQLPGKLVSRCHGGVCAEITLPSNASRTTLLSHFAAALQLPVSEDLLRVLARQLPLSPRELHGALINLRNLADGSRRRMDLETAQAIIRELTAAAGPSIADIARIVSSEFGVAVTMMRSPGRVQSTVTARQTAMYLARTLANQSLNAIGDYFGGRNHATVLHACRQVAKQLTEDQELNHRIQQVQRQLRLNGFRPCAELVDDELAVPE